MMETMKRNSGSTSIRAVNEALSLAALAVALAAPLGALAEEQPAPATPEAQPEATPEATAAPEAEPAPALLSAPAGGAGEAVLLFTSDLDGALVDLSCGDTRRPALLPRIGAAVAQARSAAGASATVVIDAGDALFPSALSSQLLSSETTAQELLRAVSAAGYDALAIGDNTLGAPTSSFTGLLQARGAAAPAGFPVVLSNVECAEGAAECAMSGLVANQAIIERGGLRIGIVNVLPEALEGAVPAASLGGATLSAPADAARARITALRGEGVDLVVLVSNLDTDETAPRETLELLAALEGAARPDVVLAASASDVVARMEGPGNAIPILTAAPGVLQRAALRREGDRWVVAAFEPVAMPEEGDPALTQTVSRWDSEYCARFDRELAGGRLAADLDAAAFAQLVLQALRERADAEISFINRRAISEAGLFPLSGQLSSAEVIRALPNDSELRIATVKGSDLTALAGTILDSPAAYSAGIERRDGTIYINGRTIRPDGRYRVVTTEYVASGGDGIVAADAASFRAVDGEDAGSPLLSRQVIHWLDTERGTEPYDPASTLDLFRRPLWYYGLTIDTSLAFTSIIDPNVPTTDADGNTVYRYNQAQLARQGLLDLRFATEFNGGMTTRGHTWDNILRLRYGRQWLEPTRDSGTDLEDWPDSESVDLIYFQTTYDMDYLRDVVLDGAWYGPSIFIQAQLESEFFHEDASPENPHFLELTGLLGLKLKPIDWLQLSLAFGIRSMVTASDPFPVPGLSLRAEVARYRLTPAERLPIYLAFYVDYFVGWPVAVPTVTDVQNVPEEGSALQKLTAELRLEIEIYGPLRFLTMFRGFVYDENPGRVAGAVDLTAGLSVAFGGSRQSF